MSDLSISDRSKSDQSKSAETIFANSMLETSWAQRCHRNWTTLASYGLEVLVIGLLLLLPVLKTVGLPSARTVSTPISLGRHVAEPAQPPRTGSASSSTSNFVGRTLMQPQRVPTTIAEGIDESSLQPPGGGVPGVDGVGLPGGSGGLPASLLGGTRPVLPVVPAPVVRAVRTSSMLEGNLIRRVQPVYPPLARTARIQGPVVLYAVISRAGTIDNLRVLSGHPLLVPAAIEAVRQWRYRPYILNSEPIEVETQITVNFLLGGN